MIVLYLKHNQHVKINLLLINLFLDTPKGKLGSNYIDNSKQNVKNKSIKSECLRSRRSSSSSSETGSSSSTMIGNNQKYPNCSYMDRDFYRPTSITKCSPLHETLY